MPKPDRRGRPAAGGIRPGRAAGVSIRLLLLALAALPSAAVAQLPSSPPPPSSPPTQAAPRLGDPYRAYEAGLYDQAVQGFLDLQVERPGDPEVALNLGSAYYKMRDYPEADRAFAAAALSSDATLQQQALYNLGNSAYRQGRLPEAVELYKAALELDPDDEDAKFNLEFVRDEIRRRHEEAQKRRQQQQDQQGQQDQQDQSEPQSRQQQGQPDGSEPPESGRQSPQGDREPQASPGEPESDADADGLPDELERKGENPTDPADPDTDGDGLPDGAEDANRNGRVDPGETDPNRPDSDGDGVPDSQEAGAAGEPTASAAEAGALSPEEAERYLQALEEGRPQRGQPQPGARRRADKDW